MRWNNHGPELNFAQIATKALASMWSFCISFRKRYASQRNIFICSMYYTLIHSRLIYGILAWGNSPHVNKLFKIQKRAIRVVSNSNYRAHTNPLFRTSKILKIEDLYHLHCCLFVHDFFESKLPVSFLNFFHQRESNTRQIKHVLTNIPRTNFSKCLSHHCIATHWNNLPLNTKLLTSRTEFKRNLTVKHLSNYENVQNCNNLHCPECNG